jgi:hypothetical protein
VSARPLPCCTTARKASVSSPCFCLGEILHGRVGEVVQAIELLEEESGASADASGRLAQIRAYLQNNAGRMKYDEYLAAGCPIASGVIEGACRHVVKDRMELSGMRWTLEGAQNLLALRCISINRHWEAFMEFYVERQSQRLVPPLASNDKAPPLRLAA